MASMVDSSPRSIWETLPGVTPIVSASWAWVRPRCLRSSAILLVAGDKAGSWSRRYARMIPRAEQLYEIYLKERAEEEGGQ